MKRERANRKRFAFMAYPGKEKGFTFISLLCTLSILALTLPFISLSFRTVKAISYEEEFSVHHFFQFLRNEVIESSQLAIENPQSILLIQDDKRITIKQHGEVIHRQVDGRGHEVYLMGVRSVRFRPLPYGVHAEIIHTNGEKYEKAIVFYPE
ncbi:hypothetical protein GCM10010978_19000 [Compostibacillus humi]|uniref:Competence protein ComGF n=1 Tax=Compostibacillus humi TaxID=1245525 RepID=A0A8J2TKB8_9BACI|nr:ComGF family competence protein [Compostibacillus humi]GFZ77658.1 hypothetical protein GCM10010978_19000 [Compostibacillus humi]